MRLLVFGRTGQVARELAATCAERGIEAEFLGRDAADLTEPMACARLIETTDADVIINAAAWTAVDKAEEDRQGARLVNGLAPTMMARAAAGRGIPILHVSTDYVFDGSGERPWREDDAPNPLSVYGRTKLAGETGVTGSGGPHAVLRTSWVFSAHGSNFVKTMRRLGAERAELRIVADQIGGPTPAADIAGALLSIAGAFANGRGVNGTYHFSGAPDVSWADFAEAILAQSPSPPKITRIPTTDYPTPAPRPLSSRLDCSLIRDVYGIERPDWHDGLARVLAQLEAQT
jgi:dTDP-4-dehydrorhamnose reductase